MLQQLRRRTELSLEFGARIALRGAQRAVARAERDLAEKRASIERVRQLIDHASAAVDEVRTAESAAAASTRRWAAQGAAADRLAGDPALLARAEEARRAATDAHTMAKGAEEALIALERQEEAARITLRQAQEAIGPAVAAVLAALVESDLAALARSRSQTLAAVENIASLRAIMRAWGPAHHFAAISDATVGADLETRLAALVVTVPPDQQLAERSAGWARLGERLKSDAAATRE